MLLEETQLGPYRLLRPIGQGGMATVYEGIDARMDRHVAIKMMAPTVASFGSPGTTEEPASMVMRLQREARLLANLSHPNVVMIYDVGQHEGHPYLVMEYLAGVTLQQYLSERAAPLSLLETADILEQIASGLDALHNAGIVHRDLKSANVMLIDREGLPPRVKLLDLGIARPALDLTLTSTGMIMGSPSYVAPEILQGQKATEASDIWSLGIMLYEMLSGGHLPFPGNELSTVLYRIAHEPPTALPALPPRVTAVLNAALSKNPSARPASAQEFAQRFREAMVAPYRSQRPMGALLTTGALALAALFVSGGWVWSQRSHPGTPKGNVTVVAQAAALPLPPAPLPVAPAVTPTVESVVIPPVKTVKTVKKAPAKKPVLARAPAPVPPIHRIKPVPVHPAVAVVKPRVAVASPRSKPRPVAVHKVSLPVVRAKKRRPVQMAMAPGHRLAKESGTTFGGVHRPTSGVDGVRRAMNTWIDASQEGELELVMRWYAPRVERYQKKTDLSLSEVRAEKQREYQQGRPEHITIDSPQITTGDEGTRITMRFRKDFMWIEAASAQPRAVWEELVWEWTAGGWRIVSERDLATLR